MNNLPEDAMVSFISDTRCEVIYFGIIFKWKRQFTNHGQRYEYNGKDVISYGYITYTVNGREVKYWNIEKDKITIIP